MNNSKKIKTFIFKLLFLFITLNLNEIIFSMSSSSRKVIVPAAQSGIRALNSKVVEPFESNISVPVNSNQIFKSMVLQKVDAQSSQDSYNKFLYAALLVAGSAMIQGSQVAYTDDEKKLENQSLYDRLVSAVRGIIFGSQKKITPISEKSEPVVDLSLVDLSSNAGSINQILYPNLAKFFEKYRCPEELETRVQRMFWFERNNEMLNEELETRVQRMFWLERDYSMLNDVECGNQSKYNWIFETNPVLKKGGFFYSKYLGGHHNFTVGSGDLFNASASGFLLKGPEIDRIINAERMKKYIEINNLDCVRIADKCLSMNGDSLCVVSKKINAGDQQQEISLREIQQLVKLAYTGYRDWQFGSNIIRDIDGNLIFVDTENLSFGTDRDHTKEECIRHLRDYAIYLSKEAQEWIDNEITCLENSDEGSENEIRLSHNSKYDTDIGIDFEKVKKEFNEIKRLKRLIEEREYKKKLQKRACEMKIATDEKFEKMIIESDSRLKGVKSE